MINYRDDYGYYIYKEKIYDTKKSIIDEAILTKDTSPNIKFSFHEHVYKKINWEHEPEFSLNELYKIRAQQLRDSYDYLVLMYSGGVDSHQMLNAFMKNNIHIDEIRSIFQPSIAKKYSLNYDPYDPFGLLNEYNSLIPWYKKIKNELINTKIVIHDFTKELETITFDSFLADYYFNHATHTALMYSQMKIFLETRRLIQDLQPLANKKIAVIYGCDKPIFTIKNNKMYSFFVDTGRGGYIDCLNYKEFRLPPYTPKMFYWSPDCPLIPIKQLHLLKKAIQKNDKFKNIAYRQAPFKIREQTVFKKIIYPDYDGTIYQSALRPNPGEKIYTSLFPEKKLMSIIEEKNRTVEQIQANLNFHNMKSRYGISVRSKYYFVGDL